MNAHRPALLVSLLVLLSCGGDSGAKALAGSPHLKGLGKLEMFANELGPAGKAALSKRFGDAVKL